MKWLTDETQTKAQRLLWIAPGDERLAGEEEKNRSAAVGACFMLERQGSEQGKRREERVASSEEKSCITACSWCMQHNLQVSLQ